MLTVGIAGRSARHETDHRLSVGLPIDAQETDSACGLERFSRDHAAAKSHNPAVGGAASSGLT
jgi:hypothetical protein